MVLDTIISWVNPAAALRELLIGLIIAVIGGFAYSKSEKTWARLTGYVSNRSAASRRWKEMQIAFYMEHPEILPAITYRGHFVQLTSIFSILTFLGLTIAQRWIPDIGHPFTVTQSSFHIFVICFGVLATVLAFVGVRAVTDISAVLYEVRYRTMEKWIEEKDKTAEQPPEEQLVESDDSSWH